MKNFLAFFAVIVFCLGTYFFAIGFDKKDNYKYSEYSYSSNHNAYVGGDAYNYIINGNYFTGYMVLGSSCYIICIICIIGCIIADGFSNLNDTLEKNGINIIHEIRQEQAKLPSLKTLTASYRYKSTSQNGINEGISVSSTPIQNSGNYYSQSNQNHNNYR